MARQKSSAIFGFFGRLCRSNSDDTFNEITSPQCASFSTKAQFAMSPLGPWLTGEPSAMISAYGGEADANRDKQGQATQRAANLHYWLFPKLIECSEAGCSFR